MIKQDELQKFASYVRLTWDRKLTESTGGNMSVRINDKIYLTPTSFIKHFFTVDDIVVVDIQGNQLAGKYQFSSEIKMHLKIYNVRKDIKSIFHAHPRNGLICAINKIKIYTSILPEAAFMLKNIAYLPYCQPGTDQFAENFIEDAKKGCNVFVLENHGVTTCGDSIEAAFARLETLETCAFLTVMQSLLKRSPSLIPAEEINKILE
ncbi:MAG: class II aldolase/adducin family protein [Atribacterota bacterium]